jgi:hypothetical protein
MLSNKCPFIKTSTSFAKVTNFLITQAKSTTNFLWSKEENLLLLKNKRTDTKKSLKTIMAVTILDLQPSSIEPLLS